MIDTPWFDIEMPVPLGDRVSPHTLKVAPSGVVSARVNVLPKYVNVAISPLPFEDHAKTLPLSHFILLA